MTSRSVLQWKQQAGDDVGGRVGAEVLCEEGQSVDECIKCRELHQKGLQRGEDQKERRRGSESAQLEAPKADPLRV